MIARLTDAQIASYHRAAVKREKALKGEGPTGWAIGPADSEPDLWDTDKTDRETFARRMLGAFGPRQDFGKLWDELKAKKDASRAAP